MTKLAKSFTISIILLYQKLISPYFPPSCRYQPTCSEYFIQAISKFGVIRGTLLGTIRLCKCHPLGGSGLDPVPDTFSLNPFKSRSKTSGQ
ncbi:membrane protein insertion efficiency factor YidD [Desulfothermus okinawensis JCM 13304]